MAKRRKEDELVESAQEAAEAAESEAHDVGLKRLSRLARQRPVTTLALAAGVGALMGAELLAAGLAGGAAVLLLQKGDLGSRARRVLDSARERIAEGVRTIEARQQRHA